VNGFETIIYEKDPDGIGWLTLNRPEVHNAVNLRMRDELWVALQAVRDDPDVRVLILRGAGDRAFSSGADITEFGTAPSFVEARRARRERDLWDLMLRLDRPVIAAIQGWALGAGCEMSLLCDIRLASPDARFALPEVDLGYIPSAGGTQTLPRSIRRGPAIEMILTGNMIDAREALRLGLINRLVPRERLYEEAGALARRIAERPAAALRYAKEAAVQGMDLPLREGLALEARLAVINLLALADQPPPG